MMIRPVKREEVDAVGQLWFELVIYHREISDLMPIPAEDGASRYAARIRWSVDDDRTQTFVAVEDGRLIGYVYGTVVDLMPEMFKDEQAGIVGDIFVTQGKRGAGIGSALMDAMKDWFRLRGVAHYEWYVAAMNTDGLRFWEHTMGGQAVMVRMRATLDDSASEGKE
ncbi:MAG: N-acetyltransferase family protein [Anaerolineae bacterium]